MELCALASCTNAAINRMVIGYKIEALLAPPGAINLVPFSFPTKNPPLLTVMVLNHFKNCLTPLALLSDSEKAFRVFFWPNYQKLTLLSDEYHFKG